MQLIRQRLRETSGFVLLTWQNFLSGNDGKRNPVIDLFILFSYGVCFVWLGFFAGAQLDLIEYTGNLLFWSIGLLSMPIWIFGVPVLVYLFDTGVLQNLWQDRCGEITKPPAVLVDEIADASRITPINQKPTQEQVIVIERTKIVIDAVLRINNNYADLFLFWFSDPVVRRELHDYYDRNGYLAIFNEIRPGNYFYINLRKLCNLTKPIPREEKKQKQEESSEPMKTKTVSATANKPTSHDTSSGLIRPD